MSGDPKKNIRVDICDFEQVLNLFDENEAPNGLRIDSEPLSLDFLRECEELINADQGQKEQLNQNTENRMTPVSSNSSPHGNANDTQRSQKPQSMVAADPTSRNHILSNMNAVRQPMSPSLSKAFQKMNLAQSLEDMPNVVNFNAERTKPKSPATATDVFPSGVEGSAKGGHPDAK